MKRIIVVKAPDGSIKPAARVDQEIVDNWKVGDSKIIEVKNYKSRNLPMHKKYWALIELAKDYWRPPPKTIVGYEIRLFTNFIKYLNNHGVDGSVLRAPVKDFLKKTSDARAKKMEQFPITKEAFHRYVKLELNYYELIRNERGVFKQPKSISFGSMNQEEFNEFYKQAFDVCWKTGMMYVFENKQQAEEAVVNKLLSFA